MKNKLKVKREPLTRTLSPKRGEGENKADEFRKIARGELFPDLDQPRKTFTESSLKELAESIKEQGIVQPLIVRLVKAKYKINEPDLTSPDYHVRELAADGHWDHAFQDKSKAKCLAFAGEANLTDRYVIVAGERRWRAAEIAGLAELPCIVRDLDAHRVFAQQIIENNQREGVNDIEEAEALKRQVDGRKLMDDSFSVEKLAKELGMSRADLYGTLVLTRLHPPVRAALTAGKISTSVAKEVAKLPTPKAQEALLKVIADENNYNYPYSVRDVQELIEDEYCKRLSDAPFKLDKVYRDNHDIAIGGDTCTVCPFRTGNMVVEFPELKAKPNVCTNPVCFGEKCKAFHLETAEHLKAKGAVVFTEKEFKAVKADYVSADRPSQYSIFTNEYESPEKILGKHTPEPVMVSTAEGLKPFIKRADIADAAKKANVELVKEHKPETAEQKTAREQKELALRESKVRRDAFVITQAKPLVKALAKLNVKTSWQVAALLVGAGEGNYDRQFEKEMKGQKDPRLNVLALLFGRSFPLDYNGEWTEEIVDAWILAGIDPVAEFEASEKLAQKSLTLPAKKLEQGKLLDVKAKTPPQKKVKAVKKSKGKKK